MVKSAKTLASVEEALNGWLKPKVFGESWDNIGLLVGSGRYSKEEKVITGIMVCNDLKPNVLEEAISKNANLVVAYHPPIFSGMKSIGYESWKERLIARCLANDVSVYSPHTTLDAIAGGITDSVIKVLEEFGSADAPLKSKAIIPSSIIDKPVSGLMYSSSFSNIASLCQSLPLNEYADVAVEINANEEKGSASIKLFSKLEFSESLNEIKKIAANSGIQEFSVPKVALPVSPFGAGRIVKFERAVELEKVIEAVKKGLGLDYVQVAFGGKHEVKSAAVCVGSGGSLLAGVPADVFITGEMSHHALLDCTLAGTSVILCNHCSSERHYMPKLASIVKLLTNVEHVFVSVEDNSPLALSN